MLWYYVEAYRSCFTFSLSVREPVGHGQHGISDAHIAIRTGCNFLRLHQHHRHYVLHISNSERCYRYGNNYKYCIDCEIILINFDNDDGNCDDNYHYNYGSDL